MVKKNTATFKQLLFQHSNVRKTKQQQHLNPLLNCCEIEKLGKLKTCPTNKHQYLNISNHFVNVSPHKRQAVGSQSVFLAEQNLSVQFVLGILDDDRHPSQLPAARC